MVVASSFFYTLTTTFSPGMILLFYLISSRSLATNLSLSSAALLSRHGGISLHLWTSPNPNKVYSWILISSILPCATPISPGAKLSARPYSYKKKKAGCPDDRRSTSGFCPLPFFYGHSKLKWPFFLQDQHSMFFRSFCLCFFFFWNIFFCAALVFFFRLLFKSLFSFCLKKMVRSIIDKGGVSRERVVVKDSNDFSRLSGHWSRSVIFTLTATNSLKIFSILSKCWDTLVPSCILLGKNRCRRNFMFTIVTDSYILCGVSQISHADSMSLTETSTLSLTTIRLAQLRRTFFFHSWEDPVLWEATAFSSSKHLHLEVPFCDAWQSYALMQ